MLGCKRLHALFHDTITAQMYEIVFSEAKRTPVAGCRLFRGRIIFSQETHSVPTRIVNK